MVEQTSEKEAGAVVEPCQAAEEIAKPTSREEEDLTIQGSIGAKEKLKSKIKGRNLRAQKHIDVSSSRSQHLKVFFF